MNMPVMDGMELARRILADPAVAGVPLLMLTSSGDCDEAKEARKTGLSAYLTKPVRRERLRESLASMVVPHVQTEPGALVFEEVLQAAAPALGLLLLAEDEPVNRRVATAMLTRGGFRVDAVGNGLEAVEAAIRSRSLALGTVRSAMPATLSSRAGSVRWVRSSFSTRANRSIESSGSSCKGAPVWFGASTAGAGIPSLLPVCFSSTHRAASTGPTGSAQDLTCIDPGTSPSGCGEDPEACRPSCPLQLGGRQPRRSPPSTHCGNPERGHLVDEDLT